MRKVIILSTLLFTLSLSNACSIGRAINQPDEKDFNFLSAGTPRSNVIAEFGKPYHSEKKAGRKVEIYKFVQGYSSGVKTGRAVLHGVADVATLGIWEIFAKPIELANSGYDMAFEITFNKNDKVVKVVPLNKNSLQEYKSNK